MDYDKYFGDDLDRNTLYTNYPGNKLMVGKISLDNAMKRMSKKEYYALVTYMDGEKLPEQYVPFGEVESEDGTLFATINPDVVSIDDICQGSNIQMVSQLGAKSMNPEYLLGPGPDTVFLYNLAKEQYDKCYGKQTDSKTM